MHVCAARYCCDALIGWLTIYFLPWISSRRFHASPRLMTLSQWISLKQCQHFWPIYVVGMEQLSQQFVWIIVWWWIISVRIIIQIFNHFAVKPLKTRVIFMFYFTHFFRLRRLKFCFKADARVRLSSLRAFFQPREKKMFKLFCCLWHLQISERFSEFCLFFRNVFMHKDFLSRFV